MNKSKVVLTPVEIDGHVKNSKNLWEYYAALPKDSTAVYDLVCMLFYLFLYLIPKESREKLDRFIVMYLGMCKNYHIDNVALNSCFTKSDFSGLTPKQIMMFEQFIQIEKESLYYNSFYLVIYALVIMAAKDYAECPNYSYIARKPLSSYAVLSGTNNLFDLGVFTKELPRVWDLRTKLVWDPKENKIDSDVIWGMYKYMAKMRYVSEYLYQYVIVTVPYGQIFPVHFFEGYISRTMQGLYDGLEMAPWEKGDMFYLTPRFYPQYILGDHGKWVNRENTMSINHY